jgi:hypothetical protein
LERGRGERMAGGPGQMQGVLERAPRVFADGRNGINLAATISNSMAEEQMIKHTRAAIEAARDKSKTWPHKLKEVLLEICIIVFAVSLSIWLHGWAESRGDRREEREFLVGLRQDLQADLHEMEVDRAAYTLELAGVHYFERVGAAGTPDIDSLDFYANSLVSDIQIDPRVSHFEALKSSGRLSIIENKELLLNITDLFTKAYPRIARRNSYVSNLRQTLMVPYYATHLQLDSKDKVINWPQLVHQSELRILAIQQETVVNNIVAYGEGIQKCKEILREIDKELK